MFSFRSLVTTFTRIPSRNKLTYYHNIKRVQPVNNCSWKIRKMSSSEDEVEVTPAFQKEKDEYLQMPLEEKRKLYKGGNHVGLEDVPTWEEYFKTEVAGDTKEDESKEVSEMDCKLSKLVSMWRGDITQLEIDAIVNAANSSLAGGGGVDGAIHRAAGKSMTAECRTLKGCDVGEAKITGGYKLPAKYVIHTVGPQSELPEKLESCYTSSLQLLLDSNLRTVAFPCISTGIYGYPQAAAAKIAISTVRKFLEEHSDKLDRVLFCIFLQEDEKLYKALMQKYFPVSLK